MPTYDYECQACGEKFEIFQSISEEPRTKCPSCGKKRLRRLIGGGSGFIFKGSGFYITDYRSEDYKQKAKAESGSAPSKSAADGAKPDSKPETPKKGEGSPKKAESSASTSPAGSR
jgi:putative FmdB family regulatory protein